MLFLNLFERDFAIQFGIVSNRNLAQATACMRP